MLQVFELSNNESIHPVQLPYYLSKKIQEKKQLEQDIEKLGKIKQQVEKETNEALQKRNLTNDTIKEYINIREELEKLGTPFSNIQKTINAVKNTLQLGYEPASIASKFANISSLERERDLENRCLLLKQKTDGYQQTFALCEQIAQMKINSDQIESVLKIIITIAKRNTNNSVSKTTATAEATSRFSNIIRKYEIIEELDTRAEALTTQINSLTKRLEGLDNFWIHKQRTIRSLIKLQCKGVREGHILYIHNFFLKYSDKIGLESLVDDLEQYANLKEALELSNEVDHIRKEISLLQEKKQSIKEKSNIIYSKLIKRKKMMRQLSKRVAKLAAAFNLPSPILTTDTMLAMLSNIIHQKSEEKENTVARKITRYNVEGKAIL